MTKWIALFLLVVAAIAACDVNGSREIPQPYRDTIAQLRDRNTSMNNERAELQHKIDMLNAECAWNARKMDTAASQALNSLGYSGTEWVVNADKLRIEKRTR